MMPISTHLIFLIRALFSHLSAICPASGENRKNGRINMTAARLTRMLLCSETILNVSRITSAFLNTLFNQAHVISLLFRFPGAVHVTHDARWQWVGSVVLPNRKYIK